MPPILALVLTFALIVFAFVLENRRNPEVTTALWIPLIWMGLIGTRFASEWLGASNGTQSAAEHLEGSALDQAVFLALYVCAILVILRRRASIVVFVANNKWLTLFFLFCLASVLWSDFTWTSLKRWIKVTEHVAMVLVVLTEPNVNQAMDALFRRFSYFTLAMSVCFIKYFPHLSRGFSQWTGEAYNMGVTTNKNALGHVCFIAGIYLVASVVRHNRGERDRMLWYLDLLMVAFSGWLLVIADAKTALVCTLVGILTILLLTKTRFGKSPRRVFVSMLLAVALAVSLEASFDLKDHFYELIGREATLTDRTFVWEDVLATENNRLIGTGFESFWLGWRAEELWAKYWWRPNQAHNGYIETYINLGALGLLFWFGLILASFKKTLSSIATEPFFGPLLYAYLVGILLFNYTDATFKAVHILYFLFFIVAVDYPRPSHKVNQRNERAIGSGWYARAAPQRFKIPPEHGVATRPRTITPRSPSH